MVWSLYRLVDKLPDYAMAFQQIFDSLLKVAECLGYGTARIRELAAGFQLSSLAAPAQSLLGALTGGASLLLLIIVMVLFLTFDARA